MASLSDLVGWRMRALGLWEAVPGSEAQPGSDSDSDSDSGSNNSHSGSNSSDGRNGDGNGTELNATELSGADRVSAVAQHLLAMQGQDWGSSRWALGIRAPGTREPDVVSAFDSGKLVRSWPMRGTIHIVSARDIGWMQRATNHRVLPGAAKRREFLGLDDASLARMTDIAIKLLEGGRSASRDELAAAWSAERIGDPERGVGPWRYHVVWWLCQNGIAVPGPVSRGADDQAEDHAPSSAGPGAAGEAAASTTIAEPRLMLTEEWIREPRALDGDEALTELATRFAVGRGPVQERDFAWWTGLTVREARRGLSAAVSEGRLVAVEIEGTNYWAAPELLDAPPAVTEAGTGRDPLLLPAFDEHLLGYTERGAVLDAQHFERIVPGRNGVFRATVARDGRTVGVWTRKRLTRRSRIEVEALPGETIDLDALQPQAAAWAAFRGTEAELVLAPKAP